MALPTRKIPYSFVAGQNQEIDSRVLPDDLIGCRNGVWRRDGRLEKREGQSKQLATQPLKGQHSMVVSNDRLGVIGQNDFSILDVQRDVLEKVSEQTCPSILRRSSVASSGDIQVVDTCFIGGYAVITYQTATIEAVPTISVYYKVVELDTNAVVVPETLIEDSSSGTALGSPRVEAITDSGTRAHILYLKNPVAGPPLTADLVLRILDLTTMVLGPEVSIATIGAFSNPTGAWLWDSTNHSGDFTEVVYWDSQATAEIETKRISPDGATILTVATGIAAGGANQQGQVAIYSKGQITETVILFQDDFGVSTPELITIDTAYSAVANGPALTGMPVLDYSAFFIVRSDQAPILAPRFLGMGTDVDAQVLVANTERIEFVEFAQNLVGISNREQLWGRIAGKPYYYQTGDGDTGDQDTFAVVPIQKGEDSDAQPNIILVAIYGTNDNPAANTVPYGAVPIGRLNVDTAINFYGMLPKGNMTPIRADEGAGAHASTEWLFAVLTRQSFGLQTAASVIFTGGADLLSIDHSIGFPVETVEAADNTYVASGTLQAFTGGQLREQTWNFRPFIESLVSQAGTLPAGAYQYIAVYERYDDRGDLIRSAPSEAVSIVQAGNTSADITFRLPVYVAGFGNEVTTPVGRVALYRTQVDGGLFFKIANVEAVPTSPLTEWPTLTRNDAVADSLLLEPLYTDSGELPSDPPPTPLDVTEFQNRIAMISGQDPDEVWISKQKAEDIGVEFSPTLRARVPPGVGDLTALASMDEKLILFKSSSIYAITGEGPNPLGQGSFGQPREVSSDIGCGNQHSIQVTEQGVFFEGEGGIWLLDRGLNLSFVGGPVIDIVPALGQQIARTISIQAVKEVYFLVQNTNTVLCYNYRWNRWTVHQYFFQSSSPTVGPTDVVQDIAKFQGRLTCMLKRTGTDELYLTTSETPSVYQDLVGVTLYPLLIQTPWFKLAGLNGWQRTKNMRLLAEYAGEHDLTVRVYYDNMTTVGNTRTWPNADLAPAAGETTYVIKWKIARQKSQSIRFEFEDGGGANAAAYRALQMMIDVGVKKHGFPVAESRKV